MRMSSLVKRQISVNSSAFPLKYNPYCRIRPIVAVSKYHTVGVKKDGTVLAVGDNKYGPCNVETWRDIVSVAACDDLTIGLKKDGTVISVGGGGMRELSSWNGIISIAGSDSIAADIKDGTVAGLKHGRTVAGLRYDGTVVTAGNNGPYFNIVSAWKDIIAISCGWFHIVGLKKDGSVVAAGDAEYDELDVASWSNVISIAAGGTCDLWAKKRWNCFLRR